MLFDLRNEYSTLFSFPCIYIHLSFLPPAFIKRCAVAWVHSWQLSSDKGLELKEELALRSVQMATPAAF